MDKNVVVEAKEMLHLLSMKIAEEHGPVVNVPMREAMALDRRIDLLMWEAFCAGQENILKDIRPEVRVFARRMERVLKENDHKGGWQDCGLNFLIKKLKEEMSEVLYEIDDNDAFMLYPDDTLKELADLGNICMMLYDNILKGRWNR